MPYGPDIADNGDVTSSALFSAGEFPEASQGQYSEMSLIEGQIQQIYAIDDPRNDEASLPGQVTLYDVLARTPDGGTEVLRRVRALQPLWGGTFNNFLEVLPPDPGTQAKEGLNSRFKKGTMVLMGFVSGQRNSAVILGALPHYNKVAVAKRPSKALGTYFETEFQGLNIKISNDGAYTLTFNGPRNDSGALINSNGPTKFDIDKSGNISFQTNNEQSVKINREAKTTTITNGQVTVELTNEKVNITASGDVNLQADKIMVKSKGKADIQVGGDANIKASGKAKVDASAIELNGAGGQILTTATDPLVDLIFGVPTMGVPTVKAG